MQIFVGTIRVVGVFVSHDMKSVLKQIKQSAQDLEQVLTKPALKDGFAREVKDLEEAVSLMNSARRRIKSKIKEAEQDD